MSEPFDRALRAAARRNRPAGVCPDAAVLAAYVDNGLSADERLHVEAHAADCVSCQQHLALLGAVSVERDPPEPVRSWSATWGWLVPVATAVLVVAVWIRLPEQQRVPQAPAPTVAHYSAERAPEESSATPMTSADQLKAGNEVATPAARVAQSSAKPAAPPAEKKRDQFAALERRDEARQKVAAPPAPVAAPAAPEADKNALALTLGRAAEQAAAAPAAAPAMADASKEEAQGAAAARRREVDGLMAKSAAPAPLVVSASPRESYRASGKTIELSQDGGATWSAVAPGAIGNITAAACRSGGPCWFGGAEGFIVRRTLTDFSFSSLPIRARVVSITTDGAQTATATVEGGKRFRTSDGGATWEPIP